MIPIFWRYAISSYLRILCLSVGTFICVLCVSRFKEIAQFAALSFNGPKTALYVLYQIPFILPLSIPLSALIASYLLFQRLSKSHELVALRASGFSFKHILAPVLITSGLVTCLNFVIAAEITPFCRRETASTLYRETTSNPLLLFERQGLIKLKGTYLQMEVEKEGRRIRDFLLVTHNKRYNRLNLLLASALQMKKDLLVGRGIAIVSHLTNDSGFDSLVIENQDCMTTTASLLSNILKKPQPKIDIHSLNLTMLQLRSQESGKWGKSAFAEILRRLSLTIAVFSFTLLGCSYGIEVGRITSRKSMFSLLGLTLCLLTSYFLCKGLRSNSLISVIVMTAPHLLIWICCLWRLQRIAKGAL